VKDGRIVQVDVLTGGSEYVSTPNLVVQGSGTGAVIRPVIENQKIVDVIIINSGIGYEQETTSVKVVPAGSVALLQANIRELTVNNQFRFNKEILVENDNLEYSWVGYDYDLASLLFGEVSTNHSPLIGWAYDGNPIYGPYGFTNPESNGSGIKLLKPGYTLDTSKIIDRPSSFSPGFFIEDYTFDGSGDLDQHNGRFCKTPEFPLGTYAYFVGVSTNTSTSKLDPIYPYFIGNTYRSPFIKEKHLVKFDYGNIREAGQPLKIFGGVSAGSTPLKELHDSLINIFDSNVGKPVNSRIVVDIMNLIGRSVVAGNISNI
jgi:hypothetical protein